MSKSRRRRRKRKNRAAANAAGAVAVQDGSSVGALHAAAGESGMRESRPSHSANGSGSNGGSPAGVVGQGFQGGSASGGVIGQGFQGGSGNVGVVGQGFQSGSSNGSVVGQGFQSGSGNGGVVGQGFQSGSSNGSGGFGQNNQGGGQNSRRNKKKKFRRAGEGESGGMPMNNAPRPPRPEPGNSLQGSTSGMGQRRNRKQQQGGGGGFSGGQNRGPRTFVGPMDHSYREANGNFADVPASTIQMNGASRHRNNGHRHMNEDRLPPELMHHNRPVVIPEDAPTHIYFFIEDLFFTAKIQEAAKQQGVKVAFMKPEKDVVAHLSELHDHEHPSLIVFDLNNVNAKPLTLIPKLKAKLKKGTSILGFLSHLQGDLKQKAVEAGCHTVMPRSAFSQNLPNLLRRYGVEDEHEPNFNQ